jgi:hypothetical protein
MTITALRKTLKDYTDQQPDQNSKIYVSQEAFTVAKYACTTEEQEFRLSGRKVFYKEYELVNRIISRDSIKNFS